MTNVFDLAIRVRGILQGPSDIEDLDAYMAPDGDVLTAGSGRNDRAATGQNSSYWLYGDTLTLAGTARGGHDLLFGTYGIKNWLVGDAYTLSDTATGGNDRLTGGAGLGPGNGGNSLLGDAHTMTGNARGGNDRLIGGDNTDNGMVGDADTMEDQSRGGNDILRGGGANARNQTMAGDAVTISDAASCGDDRLYGGDNALGSMICGDAVQGHSSGRFGNDLIVGGGGFEILVGDIARADGVFTCGNDRLVAGSGNVLMYGDIQRPMGGFDVSAIVHGADTFVFGRNTSDANIYDFQPGLDHIEISRQTGIRNFGDLVIEPDQFGTAVIIHIDADSTITVVNIQSLTPEDFYFR